MTDLRFALRQLRKTPGFTAAAALTLAVGIGAAASMFSALRALVLEPFAFPQSDQLVHVWSNDGQPLSTPDFFDLAESATSFSALGVYSPRPGNLGGASAEAVHSVSVTSGVLAAFGVQPQLGRWLEPADDEPGAPSVVVLSHALWQRAFGGDPALVGQTIRFNSAETTVIGIMPAHFEFAAPWMRTAAADLWVPLQLKRSEGERGSHWLCALGRLQPGVSVAAADAEIKSIGARLKAAHPATNSQKPFLVRSLHEEMTRHIASRTWLLFGAVLLVLLIACANVASMLLARGARRQGEFGVRIALGATRGDLLRLALWESLGLAVISAILGILFAHVGVRALAALAPVSEARRAAMTLDLPVLGFAVAAAVVSALLAGVPPALAAGRFSISELLRLDARGAAGSRARHDLLRVLIIAQVALAFVLANGAALFSASYLRLVSANRALSTDQVLSAQLNFRGERYQDREKRGESWQQLAERVARLPGVTAAGFTSKLPLEGGANMNILVNDEVFDPLARRVLAEVSSITPDYFAAAGLPVLRGRALRLDDHGAKQIGVVVNRALAEQCWPNQDPLGQVIRPSAQEAWFEARVVGVVENVRQWGPEQEPKPEIYWSPARAWGNTGFLIVRSTQPASNLAAALRAEVLAFDADLPLSRVRTLQTVVDEATQGQRVVTQLVDAFMMLALGLLAVGLYGTLSYHVLQRTREIGVRMAIGASRRQIAVLVLRQGTAWAALGVLIGLVGAVALTWSLRPLVYGLATIDISALAWAAVVVALATGLACWWPAHRAARVHPMEALRAD